jgi:hypothetical protein
LQASHASASSSNSSKGDRHQSSTWKAARIFQTSP